MKPDSLTTPRSIEDLPDQVVGVHQPGDRPVLRGAGSSRRGPSLVRARTVFDPLWTQHLVPAMFERRLISRNQ